MFGADSVALYAHFKVNKLSFPRRRESSIDVGMQRDFTPIVYILASRRNGTLYIGVTTNLLKRVAEHRARLGDGFTAQYAVKLLVWYEVHASIEAAIIREKQLKKWNRAWKMRLIEKVNPEWCDLALDLGFDPIG